MALIVLIGAQAVGKMTVGRELEKRIDGKLLFNHQTIDLFANFLGYTEDAFALSDATRIALFQSFVKNKKQNMTDSIIFTLLIAFDLQDNLDYLAEIAAIFTEVDEAVYFVELVADLEERLKRNCHETRLLAKPSKRNLYFSEKELVTTHQKHRLVSLEDEMLTLFPEIPYLKIDNTLLAPEAVSEQIVKQFGLK